MTNAADQDTITRRLIALNDRLDRQIDKLLGQLGLTRELAARAASAIPAAQREALAARIERELPPSTIDFERLRRPGAEDLQRNAARLQLLRA